MSVGSKVGAASGVSVAGSVGMASSCCLHPTAAMSNPNIRIAIANVTSLERIIATTSASLYATTMARHSGLTIP